jgi:hypothetical protein
MLRKKQLLSPPPFAGSQVLEPVPKGLRHFPLRAPVFRCVGWCGGALAHCVFSCLHERKLAVSQQTQELSVAKERPLPQRKTRGVWGSGSHLSQLPQPSEGLSSYSPSPGPSL